MPFFSISASEFVEVFAGVGASRVRDLRLERSLRGAFERPQGSSRPRSRRPASSSLMRSTRWGRQRSAGFGQGNDEREQTVRPAIAWHELNMI